jgi:hypothetical protein
MKTFLYAVAFSPSGEFVASEGTPKGINMACPVVGRESKTGDYYAHVSSNAIPYHIRYRRHIIPC